MRLTAGTEIGRYKLIDVRGRGGVGVVHRAIDLDLDRVVALKLIDPRFGPDPDILGRFALEAELARVLEHPNVMPIYEAGEYEGLLYIAMPLIEGPSIKELIANEGQLQPRRAWPIVAQIADALDAAHEAGVVHRDVKPQNILIAKHEKRDHALLTDFGLVKQMTLDTELTNTGQLMGSLHYLAPEQIEGRPPDGRADVYSLGCVLFECLTGRVPFTGDTGYSLLWAHVNAIPPRASELRPDLGDAIDLVIGKAMAKLPEDRHLTAGDLAEDARRALHLPRRKASPAARAFEENAITGPRDLWAKPPGKVPVLEGAKVPAPPKPRWSYGPIAVAIAILVAGIPLLRSDTPARPPQAGSVLAEVPSELPHEGDPALTATSSEGRAPRVPRKAASLVTRTDVGDARVARAPERAEMSGAVELTDEVTTQPIPGVNGKIAYSEGGEIYTMWPDGRGLENLTAPEGGFAYWPRWSPDGTKIAFHNDPGQIWVMDADGSNARALAAGFRPSWSPDGSQIAFMNNGAQGSFDIFVMNSDGTEIRRLTSSPLDEFSPDWSPDGAQIAYTRGNFNAGQSDIWVMNSDGSVQRELVARVLSEADPDWSPDGRTILFNGVDNNNTWEIFSVDLDGRNFTQLTTTSNLAGHPSWSPDGKKIVFVAGHAEAWRLHTMDADGSNIRLLTPSNGIRQVPSWQPRCTIKGTRADDRLIGTDGADLICGLDGNDTIISGGGNDQVFAASGDDRIVGGMGADLLVAASGDDTLLGGAGIDRLSGGPGRDSFHGGAGGDYCYEPGEARGTRCS